MPARRNESDRRPMEAAERHAETWRDDTSSAAGAGQNRSRRPHPEKHAPTAYDMKPLHVRLRCLADDELKRIRVLPAGSKLEQGATYFDLRRPEDGPFTATANMKAAEENRLVARTSVDSQLWSKLTASSNGERREAAPAAERQGRKVR